MNRLLIKYNTNNIWSNIFYVKGSSFFYYKDDQIIVINGIGDIKLF
jgi:hypothetical protein